MSDESTPDVPEDDEPFGATLYRLLREIGLGTAGMKYDEVQQFKQADREGVIRLLRQQGFASSYAMIQALKKESPEEIARRIQTNLSVAASQSAVTMMMMIAMI